VALRKEAKMISETKDMMGKVVWFPVAKQVPVTRTCPICFGKGQVILILGNGDSVLLPCDYCGKGHDYPMGTVQEYDFVCDAFSGIVDNIEIRNFGTEKEEIFFHLLDHYSIMHKDAFYTKEEALKEAEILKKEQEEREANRVEYLKKDKKKSFSWNAGYHTREANSLEKRIEYHRKMAVLCKARSKEEKGRIPAPQATNCSPEDRPTNKPQLATA
jgi:hypothetical protein